MQLHRNREDFDAVGARLVVIADAGHASNQEQPAAFNAAVREFLTTRC